MANGRPMKTDVAEMPPAYPVPPPPGADPGYGLEPAVFSMQPGPSLSVSSKPGYSQSPPTPVAWADDPPPWSPPVPGQPFGYVNGPYRSQQQQVVVIGAAGPSAALPVVYTDSFVGHIVLSCFVVWCCNLLFGLIAFILAVIASDKAVNDPRQARSLGKASYGVSVAGIAIAVVIVLVVSVVFGRTARLHSNLNGVSTTCSYYYYNSVCYRTYSRYYSMSQCTTYFNGYYYGSYCYYNY